MKLGARSVKTGIAIVFSLFLAQLLNLPNPVFAGIAAIFAIQPSIYRSYLQVIERIQGNLIGATVAVVFVLIFGHQLVIVGLAAVIVILIMLKLGLEKSIGISLVTMVAVMEVQGDSFLLFASLRVLTILIGVLAAFLVNLVFLPPKYEVKLFQSIHQVQDEIIRWIRLTGRQASDYLATKNVIVNSRDQLTKIDQLYALYKEERYYLKKNQYAKARKLVLYRQMIVTSNASLQVLKKLHLHENELGVLPEQFKMMIQERLDALLTYHEQLHLKFVGKLKADQMSTGLHDEYIQRHEVMDIFLNEIALSKEEKEEFSTYYLLHILSSILNYEEQLEHLDSLVVTYQRRYDSEANTKFDDEIY
ncbi:FUSC family protein [Sporosarcina aquimarina]|uniref:Aromatic acid exporter family protein n=1 Tax=Sporosarcina aquimarina TaxID=114975 RepID=A0ABU4G1J3_9BACL|nr:aromatic acid exporter family protein [Sporosarcina aquimarina]MDW0110821.1 aromatic acid exporter family protein [Sporosarcina aquimarina]